MKPSLGRIVHMTDHTILEQPRFAAMIVRCRARAPEDRPPPERPKGAVYGEDNHVVDLRVFSVTGEFTVLDVEFEPDATDRKEGWFGGRSWSWPERV